MERSALLLVDFFSAYDFADAEPLMKCMASILPNVHTLKEWATQRRLPVIYANDHSNDWRADFNELVDRCERSTRLGEQTVELLRPTSNDYLVVKHRHSAFFETYLPSLLVELEISRLIVVGATTEQCILFTANDAHLRKLDLWIPSNCVASAKARFRISTLRYFRDVLSAETHPFDSTATTQSM